jgi:arsenate reductase
MPAAGVHPHVRSLHRRDRPATGTEAEDRVPEAAHRRRESAPPTWSITMGCGDVCPVVPGVRYEDWSGRRPRVGLARKACEAIRDDIAAPRPQAHRLAPH